MKKIITTLALCNIAVMSTASGVNRVYQAYRKMPINQNAQMQVLNAQNETNAATQFARSEQNLGKITSEYQTTTLPETISVNPVTIPVGTPAPLTFKTKAEAQAAFKARQAELAAQTPKELPVTFTKTELEKFKDVNNKLIEQGKNPLNGHNFHIQQAGTAGNTTSMTQYLNNAKPEKILKNQEIGIKKAQESDIFHNMSTFDKAYLGGSLAAVAGIFGYDALQKEEELINQPANPSVIEESTTAVVVPTDDNPAPQAVDVVDIAQQLASAPVLTEQQIARTWTNFIKTNAYENPTNAMIQAYQNPTMTNIGNALMDPVVAGILLTTAAGSFLYYQYMKYAEQLVKKAEEKKAALQE